ncbi:MAG TPA: tetratricopeptide repeat protein [Candidatus Paceibacterota bacterium]|nr:tetratricopeptide repeat protein [Candidatus Paceibacterota bacterium]
MHAFLASAQKKPLTYAALALFIGGAFALFVVPLFSGRPATDLAGGDEVAEWSWDGPYRDGGTLEDQADRDIAKLKAELGKGKTPDYQLLVSIAGQYELLGEGKSAYAYLNQAIKEDPKQGLAYINLGHLMESLGAYETAREAYDMAVRMEPANQVYAEARTEFMDRNFDN